jgi:hypothetical protein
MRFRLITLALAGIALATPGPVWAQYNYNNPYGRESPTAGLLSGRAAMTNAAAAVVNSQAAMAKAVGDAAGSNVKALESLESARGRAVENSVKATSVFYEKRKLFEAYQGLSAGQRPSRDDMLRYSKTALAARLDPSQFDAQGNVHWPELFLRSEFNDPRTQLDYVFAQRNLQPSDAGSDLERTSRTAVAQMRRDLRRMMSELTPPEYAAARRFLDGLALEVQLGPRADAMLKTAEVPPAGGAKVAGK